MDARSICMVRHKGLFREYKLSEILVKGNIRRQLERQRDGLTGHLEETGYPFSTIGWDKPLAPTDQNLPGWWPYEQTAYWLDGYCRTAFLLRDEEMVCEALARIDRALSQTAPDGYIGPSFLRNPEGMQRWPHVVFFRAVWAAYLFTGDDKYPQTMARHYLNVPCDYSQSRNALNIEHMLNLYAWHHDDRLLDMAIKTYRDFNAQETGDLNENCMSSNRAAHTHGVSYNEHLKLGSMLFAVTGDRAYLKPVLTAYRKIDRYQMLPDGLHSCNEALRDNHYMQTHEACDVTDYTWSAGYALMATGNGEFADKIERCVYNAGFGHVTENFDALQYFSGLNQVILNRTSNHCFYTRGSDWMAYRPAHVTACCGGNINRFFPNFAGRMYLQAEGGPVVVFYGESELHTEFEGCRIYISQRTDYPLGETVTLSLNPERLCNFTLRCRIPGFCRESYIVTLNGKPIEHNLDKGFICISREWRRGDEIKLRLPSKAEYVRTNQGICVSKGCLLYALPIAERLETAGENRGRFHEFDRYPASEFAYGLDPTQPLQLNSDGSIFVNAISVTNWKLRPRHSAVVSQREDRSDAKRVEGEFWFTPPFPRKPVFGNQERVRLIPYGQTTLRVSVFPIYTKEAD